MSPRDKLIAKAKAYRERLDREEALLYADRPEELQRLRALRHDEYTLKQMRQQLKKPAGGSK